MTTALEGGEGSASHPARSFPPGKTRYPLYMKLVGPQGQCGQVRKISPPPGSDCQTIQPVASRYTDYATRPTSCCMAACKIFSTQAKYIFPILWRAFYLSKLLLFFFLFLFLFLSLLLFLFCLIF